jgi:DNA-directed RNA polymerase specialized sigma24 family protein
MLRASPRLRPFRQPDAPPPPAPAARWPARTVGETRSSSVARTPDAACLRDLLLHDVSADDRLLLVLWYAEGMSTAEVAATMGCGEPVVRARHEHLLAELRRAVADRHA